MTKDTLMGRFSGLHAWITGGGSGLGRALALELARQGAAVAVSGRRVANLDETVRQIEAAGGRGLAAPCDVTDPASVDAARDGILEAFGGLEVVVANAGYAVGGRVESMPIADWRRQFEVNVIGLVITVQSAMPALKQSQGRLVLIGSVAGFIGTPKGGAYSASKHAVRGIGNTLFLELNGTGVSVTTIHPGFVQSEIAQVDNQGQFDPDRKDKRPKNLMWKTEDAARVMARAIARRQREYVFTGHGKLAVWASQLFPTPLYALFARFG
jgi:NAD(P)-dependent dehydrogenase (short-subunit alcohol dehydrogenase family)